MIHGFFPLNLTISSAQELEMKRDLHDFLFVGAWYGSKATA
jgi:hypothetical protein